MGLIKVTDTLYINNDMKRGWVRGEGQPKWHESLYTRWIDMWRRCNDPNDWRYEKYKDCPIDERYIRLSNYVHDIQLLDNFYLLEENPSMYHIDKDIKDSNNRCYYFEYLTIVPKKDNIKEQLDRNGLPNPYIKDFKPIRGINIDDGSVIILMTKEELKNKGFRLSHINECLEGKRKSHGRYHWEYLKED